MPDLQSFGYENAPRNCLSADQMCLDEQYLPARSHSNARTRGQFKPRNVNKGTSSYQLRQFAEATLGSGSLRKAVKLPDGEDLNEWLAVNGRCFTIGQLSEADPNIFSGGLLQPNKPPVRLYNGILFAAIMS